jgi:hypothetical protein
MNYLRLLYESMPDNAQLIAKKGYNSIAEAEVRTIGYLLDTNIISTLDRLDLKSHPEIEYYAYDEAEQHTFVAPKVSGKNDIIGEAIQGRASWRDRVTTLHENDSHRYDVECHEPFVAELPNTTIFGPHALARTSDGKLPLEVKANLRDRGGSFDAMFRSTLRWFGRTNTMKSIIKPGQSDQHFEVAASILTGRKNTTPAYGHWLAEILPRIRGIKYYQKQSGRIPTILVNPNITDWQIETLELVGIDTSNLKKWEGGQASVDRYVLPMWAKSEWCTSDIDWIRKQIESKVDYEKHLDRFSSRIYLSRDNMDRRQVINRKQVVDAISEYGFESYSPELMTFAEQVALFKSAETIIGPTGGSFTNVIFSDNANIIELFQPEHFITWFFELSQVLDHMYHPFFGSDIDEDPTLKSHHQDFIIPAYKLTELIEGIVPENDY